MGTSTPPPDLESSRVIDWLQFRTNVASALAWAIIAFLATWAVIVIRRRVVPRVPWERARQALLGSWLWAGIVIAVVGLFASPLRLALETPSDWIVAVLVVVPSSAVALWCFDRYDRRFSVGRVRSSRLLTFPVPQTTLVAGPQTELVNSPSIKFAGVEVKRDATITLGETVRINNFNPAGKFIVGFTLKHVQGSEISPGHWITATSSHPRLIWVRHDEHHPDAIYRECELPFGGVGRVVIARHYHSKSGSIVEHDVTLPSYDIRDGESVVADAIRVRSFAGQTLLIIAELGVYRIGKSGYSQEWEGTMTLTIDDESNALKIDLTGRCIVIDGQSVPEEETS